MEWVKRIKRNREIKRLSIEKADLEWQSFINKSNDDFPHEDVGIKILAKYCRITVLKNLNMINKPSETKPNA